MAETQWRSPTCLEYAHVRNQTIGDEVYDTYAASMPDGYTHVMTLCIAIFNWRVSRLGWHDRIRRELGDRG